MNPYFTVNDSEHFTFYRIPKLLFTDEIYQTVSTDAKMLYGLLLDRLSLSEKNDWKDEHGRVYQYFTIHQAQELLHFGHEKVCRLFAELDAADLISMNTASGMCWSNVRSTTARHLIRRHGECTRPTVKGC